jgi:hypothetical protein
VISGLTRTAVAHAFKTAVHATVAGDLVIAQNFERGAHSMPQLLRSAVLAMTISACSVHAQRIETGRQHQFDLKFENGLVIIWTPTSDDTKANQVEIFDEQAHVVTSFNVLRFVKEAGSVSIRDVSARLGSMIAVAAMYESKGDGHFVRPAASLLLFDFHGALLSAFALEPSRTVRRLEVDDKSNIWTLTARADKEASTGPMLVEYRADGTILREAPSRSLFPFHASRTRESPDIGRPSLGYSSGVLWLWLPGSTDLVTVSANDTKTAVVKTQLPKRMGRNVVPLDVFGGSKSGGVVAEVREDGDKGQFDLAYYNWSTIGLSWSRFKPGACDGDRLIGVDGESQIYVRFEPDHLQICKFQAH